MLLIAILLLLILINFSIKKYTNSIPKIIHQTAPSDKSKWHKMWPKCQESWIRNFPGWEYRMWTDEDLDEFMSSYYPDYYEMYTSYDVNIKRIDAARYFILREYGGLYADMDFECIKNFESLLPPDKVSVAESAYEGEGFQNALMASPRAHPFWDCVIDDLVKHSRDSHVHFATGPQVIVRVNILKPEMVHPLPVDAFGAVTKPYYQYLQETFDRTNENVYAVHHGTCVWCS